MTICDCSDADQDDDKDYNDDDDDDGGGGCAPAGDDGKAFLDSECSESHLHALTFPVISGMNQVMKLFMDIPEWVLPYSS